MTRDEISYYRDRAEQERARAQEAARQDVAVIHEELARLYDALITVSGPTPTLHVVGGRTFSASA